LDLTLSQMLALSMNNNCFLCKKLNQSDNFEEAVRGWFSKVNRPWLFFWVEMQMIFSLAEFCQRSEVFLTPIVQRSHIIVIQSMH